VTVTVGALSDKPGFYVFDDGPGIPEGDGDSVFEPGYTTREEEPDLGSLLSPKWSLHMGGRFR